MSTFGRPLTDDSIARVLDHWLDDGPVVAPDLMVESALRTAARTPQRRWPARLTRMIAFPSPPLSVSLTLAGVTAVVVLAIGFGLVSVGIPPGGASPMPSSNPTPVPTLLPGMRLYQDPLLGFEIAVREEWELRELTSHGGPAPGVVGFGSANSHNYPAMTVSIGDATGSVFVCNGGLFCTEEHATTLNELAEAVEGMGPVPGPLPDMREVSEDITLDGEPARYEGFSSNVGWSVVPAFNRVLAFHEGRPVVISFDHWTYRTALSFSEQMHIDSFSFLDSEEGPSGPVLYTNEEDGYELTLPARWTPAEFFTDPPGAMRFGDAHLQGHQIGSSFGAVTVSMGAADGTVYDCAPSVCRPIVATTIDQLDDAIANDSNQTATPTITTVDVDVTLDGEPARLEYVTFAGGLIEAGPQFHHVFATHNGRPVVLSFDKYAYGIGRQSNDVRWVESLVQGFRFLDRHESPAPSPDDSDQATWKTVELANAGLAVDIPSDWVVDAGADPAVVTIRGMSGSVQVRAGDPSGHISTCLVLAPCQLVEARSMDDLIGVARGEYRVRWGLEPTMGPTVRDQRVILDGVDAVRVTISPPGGMTGPGTERYLVFMRNEQAVILQWGPVFSGPGLWDEIIASIRFID